ncbi:dTDP-4-dehydrorhamnose 3,5-epimerase [Rhizobium sp. BK060]|uniref:dTDP-4-dehydrorhamnose 3,5-epimerase n=1 Tax=Rhizobium sp. BK060 TaxID=2587096 RepID=UPI00161C94A2|nr:dTDP-4-dehydrorhamnose 3,5-epimerase [Rhizobium sp. BK060]MBB3393380.1 dTDP-4-dehydrorhamnose 3,5-epimerase [Rhizobium sp. BK060]
MKATPLEIADVLLVEPTVYGDDRGFFFESFNQARFNAAVGRDVSFVQDNHSKSAKGVLRGLHYQIRRPQGKLVRVVDGTVFDVAVDMRKGSPTFGKWVGETLSADNKRQLWIPPGFAHGFLVLSDCAQFLYKTTDFYSPENERAVIWNDRDLNIAWPIKGAPLLSEKDAMASTFEHAELFLDQADAEGDASIKS